MKVGDLVKYYDRVYVVVSDAKLRSDAPFGPGVSSKIEVRSMHPCWPGGWLFTDDPNLEFLSKGSDE